MNFYTPINELTREKIELDILRINQLFKPKIDSNEVSDIIKNVDSYKIENYINKNYYNVNLMNLLNYLFDLVLYMPISIKKVFPKTEFLSGSGEYGEVELADFKSSDNLFVLKSSKKGGDANSALFHEYFIGCKGTNFLRKYTPNFAYVIGAFKCVNSSNHIDYIIYEYVKGKSVRNSIAEMDFETFLKYFTMLLLSYMQAMKVKFTHYDLHTENVILKETTNSYVAYKDDKNNDIYIKSDFLPTIIDFGMSHIVYDNIHFGDYDYSLKTRPFYDFYKFLMFSAEDALNANNVSLCHEIYNLVNFINPMTYSVYLQTLKTSVDKEDNKRLNFYVLSLNKTDFEKNTSIQDYYNYIKLHYIKMVDNFISIVVPENSEIIGCSESNHCDTSLDILNQVVINNDHIDKIYNLTLNYEANMKALSKISVRSYLQDETAQNYAELKENINKFKFDIALILQKNKEDIKKYVNDEGDIINSRISKLYYSVDASHSITLLLQKYSKLVSSIYDFVELIFLINKAINISNCNFKLNVEIDKKKLPLILKKLKMKTKSNEMYNSELKSRILDYIKQIKNI